jgi:endoglucanase Acf2
MPTNQWWSSAAWLPWSDTMYPDPWQITATPAGLEANDPAGWVTPVGYFRDPGPPLHSAWRQATDFTLGTTAVVRFATKYVAAYSEWAVTLRWRSNTGAVMTVTAAEGWPFLDATYRGGQPQLTFSGVPRIFFGAPGSAVLGVVIHGHAYGLFGPAGARWTDVGTRTLVCHCPGHRPYVAVASLPNAQSATVRYFARYAYDFCARTFVTVHVHVATGQVQTTYHMATRPMQGRDRGTLWALYPAQWDAVASGTRFLPYRYLSSHGVMKTVAGPSFSTDLTYHGFLPFLLPVGLQHRAALLRALQAAATANQGEYDTPVFRAIGGDNTYTEGVADGRIAQLIPVAQALGQTALARHWLEWVERQEASAFTAIAPRGRHKVTHLFYYDPVWGTLIGYPSGFGSARALNDHSLQYGYWIHTAAQIALNDPAWAAPQRWGGMVNLLIDDIADSSGGRSFPTWRVFDPYAGHTWTSGNATFDDGNNLESSSEAIQAWAGVIEWAAATHQPRLERLGIYLYTTEVHTVWDTWFRSARYWPGRLRAVQDGWWQVWRRTGPHTVCVTVTGSQPWTWAIVHVRLPGRPPINQRMQHRSGNVWTATIAGVGGRTPLRVSYTFELQGSAAGWTTRPATVDVVSSTPLVTATTCQAGVPGAQVTLVGAWGPKGLRPAVQIGGVTAPIVKRTSTTITVRVPILTPERTRLTVTEGGDTAPAEPFVVLPNYTALQWGGKSVAQTWFSANPVMIRGINLVPLTGASLYLGWHPRYTAAFVAQLAAQTGTVRWPQWADAIWEFDALAHPRAAKRLAEYDLTAQPEPGDSPPHTLSWLDTLAAVGRVTPSITADTALYAVFTAHTGARTYVADNPSNHAIRVRFSNGQTLLVPAHAMAWTGAFHGACDQWMVPPGG